MTPETKSQTSTDPVASLVAGIDRVLDDLAKHNTPCPAAEAQKPVAKCKMTAEQEKLREAHGTPREFAEACNAAVADLMITPDECDTAIKAYIREWNEAAL